jgi:xylose isomerase
MRTYLILKERAAAWNADAEIQALVQASSAGNPLFSTYSAKAHAQLLDRPLDRTEIASKGLAYERLDQLTIEVLLGVR